MWNVQYSLEASNYLYENWPDETIAESSPFLNVFGVFHEIERIAQTEGAIPPVDMYHSQTDRVYWLIAHHLVIYRRIPNQRVLYVSIIKPLE